MEPRVPENTFLVPSLLTHLHFNWGVMVCKEQTKYQRPAGRRGWGEQSKSGRFYSEQLRHQGISRDAQNTVLRAKQELQKIHQSRGKSQCWNPGSGSKLHKIQTRHFCASHTMALHLFISDSQVNNMAKCSSTQEILYQPVLSANPHRLHF